MTELFRDPALVLLLLFVIPLALRVPIAICLGLSASIICLDVRHGHRYAALQLFADV